MNDKSNIWIEQITRKILEKARKSRKDKGTMSKIKSTKKSEDTNFTEWRLNKTKRFKRTNDDTHIQLKLWYLTVSKEFSLQEERDGNNVLSIKYISINRVFSIQSIVNANKVFCDLSLKLFWIPP